MERARDIKSKFALAESRIQPCRAEQKDADPKTQELIRVAEGLAVKVGKKTRMKIAESCPGEDQKTTTTDDDTMDSDGDVDMGELSTATAPKRGRLVLNPPVPSSVENIRPTRLRLNPPKRQISSSVATTRPIRLRLNPPKRAVATIRPIRLRLNPPKREVSPSMAKFRPVRLRLNPPKRQISSCVATIRPFRLRLSQPKRERSVSGDKFRPTLLKLRLSQPRR